MGSWSITHWLVVLAVVILVFGTGKIKNMGKDLGEGLRSMKDAFKEAESAAEEVRKIK